MSPFAAELLAICRSIGFLERQQVCCGTVSVPQCVALQLLLAGPLSASDLAAGLGSSPSATSRLVDGLRKRGWVERERNPDDRRSVAVGLTAPGRAEAERLRQLTDAGLAELLRHIPAAEHATVLRALGLVRHALEQVRGKLGCC